jgi:hypothetical protein
MRILSTAALVALLSIPLRAEAQPPPKGDEAASAVARAAGDEGLKHFSAARWTEAYEAFRAADAAFHAPTLVLYMAHCKRMLGKLAAARALYQKVADESLEPGAPAQFTTAQAMAREEIEKLRRHLASLEITLAGAPDRQARVTVDGEPVPPAERGAIPLDPGGHVVMVEDPGALPIKQTVTLKEGTVTQIRIPVAERPPPAAAPPPSPPPPSPLPAAAPRAGWRGVPAPALIAFGAGALGLVTGAITGGAALAQAARAKARCRPDNHCPAADQGKADAAARVGDASTATFVVGAAALGAGVALLILRPGDPGSAAPPASVQVGLDGVSLRGVF